jgi:hypothetical protein
MLDQLLPHGRTSTLSDRAVASPDAGAGRHHADARASTAVGPLDALHRNLLDAMWSARLTSSDIFEPLIAIALKHVEALKDQGLSTIPWRVAMFGRAHVTTRKLAYLHPNNQGSVKFLDLDTGRRDRPVLPEMCYGAPVDPSADITTDRVGALLLFDDGAYRCIQPYCTGSIGSLARPHATALDLRAAQ